MAALASQSRDSLGLRLPLVLLAALLWLALPLAGRAAEVGTIEGQVVVRSSAGTVAGTTVLLEMATPTMAQPEERSVQAGEDGGFRFENVPLGSDYVYLLRVTYEGGSYFQEVTFEEGATTARAAPLEVYPSTRDGSAITMPRMRMLISTGDAGVLQVIETGAFRNGSDRAYIGPPNSPDATTLRFGLPRDAGNLQLAQGLNRNTVVPIEEGDLYGFATLEAIPPGEQQFAYLYRIATDGQTYSLDRVLPYQTGTFQIFLPAGARLESAGTTFRDNGETTLQNGQRFHLYTAQDLAPSTRVQARFTRLPAASGAQRNPLIVPMLIFLLVLGLGLIAVYGRQRRSATATATGRAARAGRGIRTVPAGASARARPALAHAETAKTPGASAGLVSNGGSGSEELEERRRQLLLELVDLDDRYEAGTIAVADYQRRRAARKSELVTVLRELEAGDRQST